MTENKTALLVIDVQKSFFHMPYWNQALAKGFESKMTQLIKIARAKGWHVVHIFHNSKGPFDPDSGYVCSMDFVDKWENDLEFNKHVHNAITESGLQNWLQQHSIDKLIISGIRTEQCCETTCRVASDLGYNCDYVSDATLTFDMKHPLSGETVKAADIVSRTELVLADRFAAIKSVDSYEA